MYKFRYFVILFILGIVSASLNVYANINDDYICKLGNVNAVDTFQIYAVCYENGGGTIEPKGVIKVPQGGQIVFTMTPDLGYKIKQIVVDGELKPVENTFTFYNVNSDHSIKVIFELDTFSIIPIPGPNGTITPDTVSMVTCKDIVKYNIIPNTGYRIFRVLIDNEDFGSIPSYTFKDVTENHTIKAEFELDFYQVEITWNEEGGNVQPGGIHVITYRDSLDIILDPFRGYHIERVIINNKIMDIAWSYRLTNITEDTYVNITFALDTFTIESKGSEHGKINPTGVVKVTYLDTTTYTMHPDVGYKLARIIVNNKNMGALDKYTFTSVLQDYVIMPIFVLDTFEIVTSHNFGGRIIPEGDNGTTFVTYKDTTTFYIIPNTGFKIKNVYVDNEEMGVIDSVVFTNVLKKHTIKVSFEVSKFVITALKNEGGTITPSTKQKITYQDSVIYYIKPNIGYVIDNVLVNDESVGPVEFYIFKNILSDQTIEAKFKLDTFYIRARYNEGGKIYPLIADYPVNFRDTITYNVVPNKGNVIEEVVIDGESIGSQAIYTFKNILEDHTIEAYFIPEEKEEDIINTIANDILIYPNPTSESFMISGSLKKPALVFSISIYDMSGRVINKLYGMNNISGAFNYFVNTNNLNSGVYNIVINADNEIQIEKIVIRK